MLPVPLPATLALSVPGELWVLAAALGCGAGQTLHATLLAPGVETYAPGLFDGWRTLSEYYEVRHVVPMVELLLALSQTCARLRAVLQPAWLPLMARLRAQRLRGAWPALLLSDRDLWPRDHMFFAATLLWPYLPEDYGRLLAVRYVRAVRAATSDTRQGLHPGLELSLKRARQESAASYETAWRQRRAQRGGQVCCLLN